MLVDRPLYRLLNLFAVELGYCIRGACGQFAEIIKTAPPIEGVEEVFRLDAPASARFDHGPVELVECVQLADSSTR